MFVKLYNQNYCKFQQSIIFKTTILAVRMKKPIIIYRVVFISKNKIYEIYAKKVAQSNMYGFIEIEGFVFGEKSSVVVDPSEEKLRGEFEKVHRTYVPMHAILRIDEVEKEGAAKITDIDDSLDNITQFPSAIYTPHKDKR